VEGRSDPTKPAVAARLMWETILTTGWIAARLQMGTRKSAAVKLHRWGKKGDPAHRTGQDYGLTPSTVYYRLSGTARNGTDYALTTNEVTLAAGQSSASVTITPVDDTDFEGSETVTLELSPSLRYLYGATTSGTLTLQDNDKPTVSVFALDEEASEVGREPGGKNNMGWSDWKRSGNLTAYDYSN